MMIIGKHGQIHAVAGKYGLSMIYLFGSQAIQGNHYLEGVDIIFDKTSDLDIAVAFRNLPTSLMETYGHLFRDMGEIFNPFDIDLVFLHEVDILLQYEIIKGVKIYGADEFLTDQFEENIMKQAGDLIYKKHIMDHEIMEAIENGYFKFEYTARS